MGSRLKDKVAIVTGAGSVGPGWGNGRATTVRFAEEGAKVFAADRDARALKETVDMAPGIATHFCDVTDNAAVAAMVRACLDRYGRVDVLVNNVGGSAPGGPVELSEDVWDAQVDLNLKSHFKNKTGYRRRMGHRQRYTQVRITGIAAERKPAARKKG